MIVTSFMGWVLMRDFGSRQKMFCQRVVNRNANRDVERKSDGQRRRQIKRGIGVGQRQAHCSRGAIAGARGEHAHQRRAAETQPANCPSHTPMQPCSSGIKMPKPRGRADLFQIAESLTGDAPIRAGTARARNWNGVTKNSSTFSMPALPTPRQPAARHEQKHAPTKQRLVKSRPFSEPLKTELCSQRHLAQQHPNDDGRGFHDREKAVA